jgi:RNA polymerase sigma-70 factor (ECF subfamily)
MQFSTCRVEILDFLRPSVQTTRQIVSHDWIRITPESPDRLYATISLMNYSQLTDERLLGLVAQKDTVAFEHIYDRHAQVVHNLVVRIVRDPAVADEIVQEAFWLMWKKAADFRQQGSAAAWLYRIARNKSLDMVRRQKRVPMLSFSHQPTPGQGGDLGGAVEENLTHTGAIHQDLTMVESAVSHEFDRRHLQRALADIPREQRLCLELAYFHGMSQRQIADHIDVPVGTVKTRIRMGLEKLEYILRAVGYREEDM